MCPMAKWEHRYHIWMLLDSYEPIRLFAGHTYESPITWSKLSSKLVNNFRQPSFDVIYGKMKIYLENPRHGFCEEGSKLDYLEVNFQNLKWF
jgi:hypothetical protein